MGIELNLDLDSNPEPNPDPESDQELITDSDPNLQINSVPAGSGCTKLPYIIKKRDEQGGNRDGA